eukprot:TRINITY_DN69382_c0_g1_i1.p1 TRINITY_DN69382_c0_g1~~TRINITY_DN69382_c0_g1_i1.p1  ORF type:complete len:288 (-),score=25.53 TRINITY_DN69382_c0_g1_i1:18-881(-)
MFDTEPLPRCADGFRVAHGWVTFDVRGRLIKVTPGLVESQPETLLAKLLDNVGNDFSEPIFVDSNPDRFAHILDWYRYGRMFLPKDASVDALLHDAAFFLLPHTVTVDGVEREVIHRTSGYHSMAGTTSHEISAARLQQKWEADMVSRWPDFESVMQAKVQEIEQKLLGGTLMTGRELHHQAKAMVRHPGLAEACRDYTRLDSLNVSARIRIVWAEEGSAGVCSPERLRLLGIRLEEAGYTCNTFQDAPGSVILEAIIPSDVGKSRTTHGSRPVEVKILAPKNARWS